MCTLRVEARAGGLRLLISCEQPWGRALHSRSVITVATITVLVATSLCFKPSVTADANVSSRRLERARVSSPFRGTWMPPGHAQNHKLSDFVASPSTSSAAADHTPPFRLDHKTDRKSGHGVRFIGGIGPPQPLSMNGAIEADTEGILPRTGYIPTKEPSLPAQGVTLGVEFRY
jgi:hypothetical protein